MDKVELGKGTNHHEFFTQMFHALIVLLLLKRPNQCDQKKSPNVCKSCPKMISQEKWLILTPLQKLPKTVRDLGKLIVAKGFKNLSKVQ